MVLLEYLIYINNIVRDKFKEFFIYIYTRVDVELILHGHIEFLLILKHQCILR